MSKATLVDFDALNLTAEQNRLALHFFDQLIGMVATSDLPATIDSGIALSVALTEFLALGLRSGLKQGFLSEERARVLVGALTDQLPKAS
jgi:hypothetical protein